MTHSIGDTFVGMTGMMTVLSVVPVFPAVPVFLPSGGTCIKGERGRAPVDETDADSAPHQIFLCPIPLSSFTIRYSPFPVRSLFSAQLFRHPHPHSASSAYQSDLPCTTRTGGVNSLRRRAASGKSRSMARTASSPSRSWRPSRACLAFDAQIAVRRYRLFRMVFVSCIRFSEFAMCSRQRGPASIALT